MWFSGTVNSKQSGNSYSCLILIWALGTVQQRQPTENKRRWRVDLILFDKGFLPVSVMKQPGKKRRAEIAKRRSKRICYQNLFYGNSEHFNFTSGFATEEIVSLYRR
jgi:hypothetical protein